MGNLVFVPKADGQAALKLQDVIDKIDIVDDDTAIVMARYTRNAAQLNKGMAGYYKEAAEEANKKHKAITKERSEALSVGSTAEATGRLKLEMWANEQYQLAKDAADNGNVTVRLFPEMDGVTLSPNAVPSVVDITQFISWCLATGNIHFLNVNATALKKYINAGSVENMCVPGVEVKIEFRATVRTAK